MSSKRARSTSLVNELRGSHRFVLGVLMSLLALSLGTSGFLLLVTAPRLSDYAEVGREVHEVHEGMLDQESALRARLATGDTSFMETYDVGRDRVDRAGGELARDVREVPGLTDGVLRTLLVGDRWQQWARRAAATELTARERTDGTLRRLLDQGSRLFEAYRVVETSTVNAIDDRHTKALARHTDALVGTLAAYLALFAGSGALALRRQQRLRTTIVRPVRNLHRTVAALRSGDLTARTEPTALPELAEIGSALAGLATDLADAEAQTATRERRLAFLAERLATVVGVGREIAGSLDVRHVSVTLTTAAAELVGASTVLWLRTEDQVFEATHRSEDPDRVAPSTRLRPPELVARAAAEARMLSASRSRAYPLVLAGTVTAVLEVSTTRIDAETETVLGSLLSTAAAALESAQLHDAARELADHDGLTRLPNRRRFDADVVTEWERCRRYGRPLSMVMLDLDHFQAINAQHGHLTGDQVLREVAKAVTASLRTTDTAYRYGGEKLVVLLRETGLQEAAAVSERLRRAVGSVRMPQHPRLHVSASAGVATRHVRMQHHGDLVVEADTALGRAKALGRDRVVTAWSGGETLFHGAAEDEPDPVTYR